MLSPPQNGAHKIVGDCGLPLTGTRCVDRIITEMVTSGTMYVYQMLVAMIILEHKY